MPNVISGLTNFGTPQQNGGPRSIAKNLTNPGFVVLQTYTDASTLVDYYLWVDPSGNLRISNVRPTDPANDGTVVGTQT